MTGARTWTAAVPHLAALHGGGKLVPFIGAGMSRPACADWASFISRLCIATHVRDDAHFPMYDLHDPRSLSGCLVGLQLFSRGLPLMAVVRAESKRVMMGLALHHSNGNISRAARELGTSRPALREALASLGLYLWLGVDSSRRS